MVKSYLYLPGLLFLASCSHAPKPQPMIDPASPVVSPAAVDEATPPPVAVQQPVSSVEILASFEPDPEVTEPPVPQPEPIPALVEGPAEVVSEFAQVEAETPTAAEANEVILETVEAVVTEANVAEPDRVEKVLVSEVQESKLEAEPSSTVDAVAPVVEPEIEAAPVEALEATDAEREAAKPVVETPIVPAPEAVKLETTEAVVSEVELPEPEPAEELVVAEVRNTEPEPDPSSVVEEVPTVVEPAPVEAKLPEKEAALVQLASGQVSTQLTLVSTTGPAIYFYSDDQLISSVPAEQLATGGLRYVGPKELDLWKPARVDGTAGSQVLESVGTVELPGNASSCMVFSARTEVTASGRGRYRFVLLEHAREHAPANSLCFVNLTASALKVRLEGSDFRIPSFSHYDGPLQEGREVILPVRIEVHTDGGAAGPVFSGTVSGQWPEMPVFLLTENATDPAGAIELQAPGLTVRAEALPLQVEAVPDPVAPLPEESSPSLKVDSLQPILPAITPETRTF
ncbi:hypothetical protein [Coraliomargarita parva]|uniref:hypothetical protein n=1 Tax=Coraliomargarita parva TaxID=3014050 RepID=UPI0022B550EE|nr:hypothetical protein [Coraliomargarita parva]